MGSALPVALSQLEVCQLYFTIFGVSLELSNYVFEVTLCKELL